MEYRISTQTASRLAADCLIIGVFEDGEQSPAARDVDEATNGWLSMQIRNRDVSTRFGNAVLLPAPEGIEADRLLMVGLGKAGEFDAARYRKAVGTAIDTLGERSLAHVAVGMTLDRSTGATPYYLARHTSERIADALYVFDQMKSSQEDEHRAIERVTLLAADDAAEAAAELGAAHGAAIAEGMRIARDLGNLPANVCTPTYLADIARQQGDTLDKLDVEVLDEDEIRELGMGSFLSVTGGTQEPARLIVMRYSGAADGKPVVLVGKGITFDAGGISLKPGPGMDEMKYDMCGAAAVIGAVSVAARLGLGINVIGVIPACENLPSGTATRPGDIVTSMSGQTIEILNTDAEGRLILCDALTYSRRFEPETIIDIATLTGACVIALGHHRSAVMSSDESLSRALVDAGIAAEDRAWPMPMAEEYAEALKSNFADFANVGGREGGAITAACFLAKFTEGLKWAHLDIAGTAWQGGADKGSTGRPVPLLLQFLLQSAGALPDN